MLAGCGGGETNSAGGLHGTVTRDPTSPVCRQGVSCSEPASGAELVFTPADGGEADVPVGKDGSYSVSLPPGVYSVRVSPQPVGRGLDPGTVRVVGGQTRRVDFQIDTGIR